MFLETHMYIHLHNYFKFDVRLYFRRRPPWDFLGSWQTNILSSMLFSFAAQEGLASPLGDPSNSYLSQRMPRPILFLIF